ncbi:MAG: tetratricopeptide repeat protein [Burkholderiales bacterium]|nr:tetratricopeptide repeat protein [Burkholderiales bacterium]
MSCTDLRGNPSGSRSEPARAAVERALWRMMSFYDTPLADLDNAVAADPGWALPHAMKAGFLLSLTEPGLVAEAHAHLARAEALAADATPRERTHLGALQQIAEGRWHAACRTWDALLVEHPRDALALQWAHLWDYYRGDAFALRQRPARALPEWDESDPLHACVLALHAFGLEEGNLYPQAEEAGRRALAADPRVPWAVHAVAHVMEMQGRFDEGSSWLRLHQPHWAEGNGFACHLWWHQALFRLEALDSVGVVRLVDHHLSGEALQITLQRVDAAAMLWRLHLLGEDVAARCRALVDDWALDGDGAGYYAFNDLHAVLAMLGAGDLAAAERHVARCAERALAPADACRSNHAMAREVGLPLMRGALAYARGDDAAACEAMYPVRAITHRFGGSHAQRDIVDQTLLAAAARGKLRALGRALVNERRMARPASPLTRHWMAQFGEREAAGVR